MYQHFSLYYQLPHHHQPPHPQLNQPHHPHPQLNQLHHQPKYLVGFIRPKEESPNQAESERVNVEKEPLSKDSHEVSVALRTSTL